jgi:hypothetical protein
MPLAVPCGEDVKEARHRVFLVRKYFTSMNEIQREQRLDLRQKDACRQHIAGLGRFQLPGLLLRRLCMHGETQGPSAM